MRRQTIVERQTLKRVDTSKKLLHMIKFIEQEGKEKAEEIDYKTEEEFNILKAKYIQEGINEVMKEYDRKEVMCKAHCKIAESRSTQRKTLDIIYKKMQMYDVLEKEIKIILFHDLSCPNKRWNIMKQLIIEALFKLLETEVIIKCRDSDANKIQSSTKELKFVYSECTGKTIKISVDSEFLPNYMLPGVIVRTPDRKIYVDNTLDSRLKQVVHNCLPVMNHVFYGTHKMRTTK